MDELEHRARRSACRRAPVPSGPTPACPPTRARIPAGALFVALAGERFDGHAYLAEARGPRRASAPWCGAARRRCPAWSCFEVDDTLRALGWLARARRRDIDGPGRGRHRHQRQDEHQGDAGRARSRTRFRVHATRANLNNLVGVPLTILEAPRRHGGAGHRGRAASVPGRDRRATARSSSPTVTVVTNATAGHLEGFGSLEAIVREKLVAGRRPACRSRSWARSRRRWPTGARRAGAAGDHGGAGRARTRVPSRSTLDAAGAAARGHRAGALHAAAAGPAPGGERDVRRGRWRRQLGLDPRAVARALATADGARRAGRAESRSGGLTILNDCYNANPHSFARRRSPRRRRAAGRAAAGVRRRDDARARRGRRRRSTREVGRRTRGARSPDLLAAVGRVRPGARGARAPELGDRLITAEDAPALGPLLAPRLAGNEFVVLKASRGVALERILPACSPAAPPHGSLRPDALLPARPARQAVSSCSTSSTTSAFRAAGAMVTALLLAFVVGPAIIRGCGPTRSGR